MKIGGSFVCLFLLCATMAALAEGATPQQESKSALTPYLSFVGVVPCRLVDTREASLPAGYGAPTLAAGTPRVFTVPEPRCGIPATARAVSLNVTVVGPTGPGFLAVWPGGSEEQPSSLVSSLNYAAGDVVPNAVIVPLGSGGQITTLTVAPTHLLVDVNGYFTDTPAAQVANTPAGSVAATTVQAAIDELASEKASSSGWTAGRVVVTGNTGQIQTDGELRFGGSPRTLSLTNGTFKTTGRQGRTVLGVSAGGALTESSGVTLLPAPGGVRILATAAGTKEVSIPVPSLERLHGAAVRLVGIRFCYSVASATADRVFGLKIRQTSDGGTPVDAALGTGDYSSPSPTCTDETLASPVDPATGAMSLVLYVQLAASHSAWLYNVRVTFEQE